MRDSPLKLPIETIIDAVKVGLVYLNPAEQYQAQIEVKNLHSYCMTHKPKPDQFLDIISSVQENLALRVRQPSLVPCYSSLCSVLTSRTFLTRLVVKDGAWIYLKIFLLRCLFSISYSSNTLIESVLLTLRRSSLELDVLIVSILPFSNRPPLPILARPLTPSRTEILRTTLTGRDISMVML